MVTDRIHINIRKAREKLGLSQSSMADELGIGRTTYINFETGKTSIFCKTLKKFASYMEMTEEQIIFGDTGCMDSLLMDRHNDYEETRKSIVEEYESRIDNLNGKLEYAQKLISAHEMTIRTLSETNEFLISQLHKND